jgi:predicted DNA-binding transcriptional regulator AlpA
MSVWISDRLTRQLVAAAQFDDARIDIDTVGVLTGLGRTKIYEEIRSGNLKPVKNISARVLRFYSGDVKQYLRRMRTAECESGDQQRVSAVAASEGGEQ